jgi:hypothetical protein
MNILLRWFDGLSLVPVFLLAMCSNTCRPANLHGRVQDIITTHSSTVTCSVHFSMIGELSVTIKKLSLLRNLFFLLFCSNITKLESTAKYLTQPALFLPLLEAGRRFVVSHSHWICGNELLAICKPGSSELHFCTSDLSLHLKDSQHSW